MRCCYSGCTNTTLRESYKFCQHHWDTFAKEYGKANTYPPWLKALISMTRAEVYAERRDAKTMVSLDKLAEAGDKELDEATLYRGVERRSKSNANRRSTSSNTEVSTVGCG